MIAEKPRVLVTTSDEEFASRYVATIAASDAAIIETGYSGFVRSPSGRGSLSPGLFIVEWGRGDRDLTAGKYP